MKAIAGRLDPLLKFHDGVDLKLTQTQLKNVGATEQAAAHHCELNKQANRNKPNKS